MFETADLMKKEVQTAGGCTQFQLRWLADESVGVLTDREEHHFFLLDSGESWYDVTQDRYPPKQKCRCKNDWFTLTLDYLPRAGTEDFRQVTPRLCCTACGREKRLTSIELDYSPTIHLWETPLSPCPAPRIKYKTYIRQGFWTPEQLKAMAAFFLERGLLPYQWHPNRETRKPTILPVPLEELDGLLPRSKAALFFSRRPMDPANARAGLWRKGELFELSGPLCIIGPKTGQFYWIEFSAEYLDKDGTITPKSPEFCQIVKDFLSLMKKL